MPVRVAILALVATAILSGQAVGDERRCRDQHPPTFECLWREANREPGASVQDFDDFTMIYVADKLLYWYFTKPSHSAHPGVIRRQTVETSKGVWHMQYNGHSFGPDEAQPAFERWLEQFKELDKQMKDYIEKEKGIAPK